MAAPAAASAVAAMQLLCSSAAAVAPLLLLLVWTSSAALEPEQLLALQAMNLPTSKDPCSLPSPFNYTTCDSSSPFRQLLSLSLANCTPDLALTPSSLRPLSPSLRSLSFSRCPLLPSPPLHLLPSLLALSSLSSFLHDPLARLPPNLTTLAVLHSPSHSLPFLLPRLPGLLSLTLSNASLRGPLPRRWRALALAHLDLSRNRLSGRVPASLGRLLALRHLDLSLNALSGALPDTLINLADLRNASFAGNSLTGSVPDVFRALPQLEHLDLSGNRLSGSVPRSLAESPGLRFLNLEGNRLRGVVPFNASFFRRVEVRLAGNPDLCYNRTVLPARIRMRLGIAPCDRFGLPVLPPPDRSADDMYGLDDGGSDGDEDSGGGGKGGGKRRGPSRLVVGVAIGVSCLAFLLLCFCLCRTCGR